LTISLPIARPFKVTVVYVPYQLFTNDGKAIANKVYSIALNKDATVDTLETRVLDILNKGSSDES